MEGMRWVGVARLNFAMLSNANPERTNDKVTERASHVISQNCSECKGGLVPDN